ncbi:uncharacterized protein [Physcomitrium patens]|uniref:Uncharacterized protein n=1 Tax=Physcomitrium patens TaxID=3218 RepID=A0A2K1IR10_PHYPA|nr:extensin-like [Physcomitrium patens]XP_024358739.1 extensin-like [Physcomitrium patens]PNR31711.1 hypothetical protein PHYPA_025834 [Physcomitrium patens]|eukprot:XP_024358738.1 extensin-like [Physcomitrella patens]
MKRSKYLALVSLLLLVFLPPGGAASPHGDVTEGRVATFGGRRGLLQAGPGSPPSTTPSTPGTTPPTPGTTPPTPGTTPPTPATTPPTPATKPPTPGATPPTPITTPPTPGVLPSPPPIAPAPAPIGVTSRQKLNAIIAGSVVAGVVGIALVAIFCRCSCLRRQKKLPFQRLQMT